MSVIWVIPEAVLIDQNCWGCNPYRRHYCVLISLSLWEAIRWKASIATSDVAVHCIVATNSNCDSNQLRLVVKSLHGDGRMREPLRPGFCDSPSCLYRRTVVLRMAVLCTGGPAGKRRHADFKNSPPQKNLKLTRNAVSVRAVRANWRLRVRDNLYAEKYRAKCPVGITCVRRLELESTRIKIDAWEVSRRLAWEPDDITFEQVATCVCRRSSSSGWQTIPRCYD